MLQAVGHALGKGLQRLLGRQVMRAGHTIAQGDAGDTELQGAEFGGAHVLSPFVLFFGVDLAFLNLGGFAFQEGTHACFGFRR